MIDSPESIISKAVDALIAQEVYTAFVRQLNDTGREMHISEVVQYSVNCRHLAEAGCTFLEREIWKNSPHQPLDDTVPEFESRKLLNDHRVRCEDLLFELVDGKLDEVMQLSVSFDWLPKTANNGPSDYIEDLVMYLEAGVASQFSPLAILPEAVKEAIHFTSCRTVANHIMHNLEGVKKFNLIAICNLDKDIKALEDFTARCPIPNLTESFSQLRQTVSLFIEEQKIEQLIDPSYRRAHYPMLGVMKMIKLFEKYKDIPFMSKLPQVRPLKAKTVDAVRKKLVKEAHNS